MANLSGKAGGLLSWGFSLPADPSWKVPFLSCFHPNSVLQGWQEAGAFGSSNSLNKTNHLPGNSGRHCITFHDLHLHFGESFIAHRSVSLLSTMLRLISEEDLYWSYSGKMHSAIVSCVHGRLWRFQPTGSELAFTKFHAVVSNARPIHCVLNLKDGCVK